MDGALNALVGTAHIDRVAGRYIISRWVIGRSRRGTDCSTRHYTGRHSAATVGTAIDVYIGRAAYRDISRRTANCRATGRTANRGSSAATSTSGAAAAAAEIGRASCR